MSSCRYSQKSLPSPVENKEQRSSPNRLNKSHGFMKFIVRNQLDRSEYDKFVKRRQSMDAVMFSNVNSNNNKLTPRLSIENKRVNRVIFGDILGEPSQNIYALNSSLAFFVVLNTDDFDLPEEWDPHFELRMKLRLKIEKEHKMMELRQRKSTTDSSAYSTDFSNQNEADNETTKMQKLEECIQHLSLN